MSIDWSALYREATKAEPVIKARMYSDYPEADWKRICYVDNYPPRVVLCFINSSISLREKEGIGEWVGKLAMEMDFDARPEFGQSMYEEWRGLDRLAYSLHPKRPGAKR